MSLVWFLFSFSSLSVSFAELPTTLKRVQAEYKKFGGVEAQFEQSTIIKSTKQTKKTTGRIWIKRPDKLRWETLTPDPNILVSDGKTFWFYTPPFEKGERGQVIIKKTKQVQTQFLNALLSGTFDFGPETKIESQSSFRFVLRPQAGSAGDVVFAEVEIDSSAKKIERVVLVHTTGNQTQIDLKEVKLQAKLGESLFRFVPDKNTDKIFE